MRGAVATGIMTWVIVWAAGGSLEASVVSGLAGIFVGAAMMRRLNRLRR